jgi:hypothetical protein
MTTVEVTDRQRMIAAIRAYANLLESTPNLPCPYSMTESSYLTEQEARDARRGTWGRWEKVNSKDSGYVRYFLVVGEPGAERYERGTVTYEIDVSKADSQCERIQTGTRHVEEYHVEAHDEPVYSWRCDSDEPTADVTVFGQEP